MLQVTEESEINLFLPKKKILFQLQQFQLDKSQKKIVNCLKVKSIFTPKDFFVFNSEMFQPKRNFIFQLQCCSKIYKRISRS